jgi:hypothetical protein
MSDHPSEDPGQHPEPGQTPKPDPHEPADPNKPADPNIPHRDPDPRQPQAAIGSTGRIHTIEPGEIVIDGRGGE